MVLTQATFYVLIVIGHIVTVSSQECGPRDVVAAGRKCNRACLQDINCRKKNTECVCDGFCGLSCVKKRCPPLPTPQNGSLVITPQERTIGAKVTYSCNNGYVISGRENRRCRANKAWSGTQPTCTRSPTEVFWETDRSNAHSGDNAQAVVRSEIDVVNYLSSRNWIPAGGASATVDLYDLLRNFQMYTGLPVTGILDEATKAKMNSPQCGNPDFGEGGFTVSVTRKKRYTHLKSRWSHHITWYLENGTPDLNISIVRLTMIRAFQHWADVIPLTFREVFSTNADIIVRFAVRDHGDDNSFDGPGQVLAHAFQPGHGRGGDIHFDDDEQFTTSTGINLLQVAVHEIGHSLGMGHSNDINAIMAPFYTYRANFALGSDDINGIQELYAGICDNTILPGLLEKHESVHDDFTHNGGWIRVKCKNNLQLSSGMYRLCNKGRWMGNSFCRPLWMI